MTAASALEDTVEGVVEVAVSVLDAVPDAASRRPGNELSVEVRGHSSSDLHTAVARDLSNESRPQRDGLIRRWTRKIIGWVKKVFTWRR